MAFWNKLRSVVGINGYMKRMIIKIFTCFKPVNKFAVLSKIRKGHVTGKI